VVVMQGASIAKWVKSSVSRREVDRCISERGETLPNEYRPFPGHQLLLFGEETDLPLLLCPECKRERESGRASLREGNENPGRVFFKCPKHNWSMCFLICWL
jgi:hypothetical protein